jgi:hypothetical protein
MLDLRFFEEARWYLGLQATVLEMSWSRDEAVAAPLRMLDVNKNERHFLRSA